MAWPACTRLGPHVVYLDSVLQQDTDSWIQQTDQNILLLCGLSLGNCLVHRKGSGKEILTRRWSMAWCCLPPLLQTTSSMQFSSFFGTILGARQTGLFLPRWLICPLYRPCQIGVHSPLANPSIKYKVSHLHPAIDRINNPSPSWISPVHNVSDGQTFCSQGTDGIRKDKEFWNQLQRNIWGHCLR